jgi:hypothetical protein|tara:strand:+ start:3121 stop:4008 length:888 start_codon:yes stop_codon:yes gene_type:complete
MAISGSNDFELDVTEYIEEAFERCGLEVRTGYDLKTAKRSLNLMLAEWANRGLNQWTIIETSIPLATGVAEYPAGTLTMTVASSSGFSVAETITGGTSSASATITSLPSATTIAITIPSGTFSSGETLTGGTSATTTTLSAAVDFSNVRKTIDFLSSVITRSSTDLSMSRVSRDSFLSIPNKATTGRPSQFFIERQSTPVLKIWPTPENSTDVIKFTRLTRMNDVDTMTNTVDMPFRFYPCLAAGLAYYIAMKRAPNKIQVLKAVYEEEFERAMTEDRDRSSFQVAPSLDYYAVY